MDDKTRTLTRRPAGASDGADEGATPTPAVGPHIEFAETAAGPASTELLVPDRRIGAYELIKPLGRGGMGQVWLARDTKLGRRVALKFVLGADEQTAARFLDEARTTAQCHHENIVVIHDVAETQGTPYIVLEHLRGTTLSDMVAAGPMSPTQAVALIVPVLRALSFAHAQQIVHRDLKPSNIFVTTSGTVKVLDFGIAKALDGRQRRELTSPGLVVGTFLYMSPEHVSGESVDQRSDIWAIGLILLELLFGQHPFERSGVPVADAIFEPTKAIPDLDRLTGVPPKLGAVIARCLRTRPEERFHTADEIIDALDASDTWARRPSADASPYPGLRAFDTADAASFHAREDDVRRARALLQEQPLIAIVGPSGAGKSSFISAGLCASLAHSGQLWDTLHLRPGRRPMTSLARLASELLGDSSQPLEERLRREPGFLATLLRAGARQRQSQTLVVVDQFEELYTQGDRVEDQTAFIACLLAIADDPSSPVRVALSVRSDFFDKLGKHFELMERVSAGLMFLPALDRDGLREALVRPADRVGYRFESDALVETILDDLEATASPLPLLQFTAARLWDGRDDERRLLTAERYAQMGGVEGALVSHADDVLRHLDDRGLACLRALFSRLVTPERTRALAAYDELVASSPDPALTRELVDRLARARLLVIHRDDREPTVELVHESLVMSWPVLTQWMDQQAESVAFVSQLQTVAKQWHERGRPTGLLWRGDAVHGARRWAERNPDHRLAPRERAFIDAALALDQRARRNRRVGIGAALAAAALIAVGSVVGMLRIRSAEGDARENAEAAQKEAEAALAAERLARQADQLARDNAERASENAERARKNAERADNEMSQRIAAEEREAEANRKHIRELQAALREARTARDQAQRETKAARDARAALKRETDRRIRELERRAKKISSSLED